MDLTRQNKRPAAFLDRDGVLIKDHGYVYKTEDLEILPGVLEGLRFLRQHSYLLIVVSNQSGVARGLFTAKQVDEFHRELQLQLNDSLGFGLDGIYYCPHHPQGSIESLAIECDCRKPGIGLVENATRDFAIDWNRSILIGDKDSDITCAHRASLVGIQVMNGQYEAHCAPDFQIQSLADLSSLWPQLEKKFVSYGAEPVTSDVL
jgi:D-glycero-D-manno-heptose 1,7-bisphosphate phosphatase